MAEWPEDRGLLAAERYGHVRECNRELAGAARRGLMKRAADARKGALEASIPTLGIDALLLLGGIIWLGGIDASLVHCALKCRNSSAFYSCNSRKD